MSDETNTAVTEAPKETHEFNKELQQVQQEKANFEKRNSTLEQQVNELRDELANVPEPIVEDGGDVDAYEQVSRTKEEVSSMKTQLADARAQAQRQETAINRMTQKSDYDAQLKAFDKVYGAKNRNQAIQRATDRCKEAGYTLTGNSHPSYDELINVVKESYIHEYYQNKDKPSTQKMTTDNGIGGSTFTGLGDDIKAGSSEYVLEQMKAQAKNQR